MNRSLWVVILSGGAIMGLSLGFRQSLGLFLTPITAGLDIGRGGFALGMGLMNLFWGLASPFTGAISDRYGAGKVAAAGGICYAAGLWCMTLSGTGSQFLLSGTLIGLGLSGVGFSVILGTVGRTAPPEKQSMALGIASMGGSIGQFVALPFAQAIIDGFGWKTSLIILALTSLLVVPLASGVGGKQPVFTGRRDQTMKEAFYEACGNGNFWLLNAGFFTCGFQLAFIAIHLPAYLADRDFAPWVAATALAILGFCNIIGSYWCGVLGGLYSKRSLLSLLYLARALIIFLFILAPISEVSVFMFCAAIGFIWLGTVPLTSGLVANLFGTTYMSMIFGIVFLGHQLGGFLGAWLSGYVYDANGSYDVIWWLCIGLGVLSAALHWPISDQPVAEGSRSREHLEGM